MKRIDKNQIVFVKLVLTMILLFIVMMWIISNVLRHDVTSYGTVNISYGSYPQLKVSNEESAKNQESTIVTLSNDSNSIVNYKLYLTIAKISTINPKFVRFSFNNKTYDLSTLNYIELNNKYYYFLEEGSIEPNGMEPFDSYIWIDSSFDGEVSSSKLIIDFDTLPM